jgi:hypothetical protein
MRLALKRNLDNETGGGGNRGIGALLLARQGSS